MDEVADIIAVTLTATSPAFAPSGPSKARYILDDTIAATGCCRSAELLDRFPLYPQLQM